MQSYDFAQKILLESLKSCLKYVIFYLNIGFANQRLNIHVATI